MNPVELGAPALWGIALASVTTALVVLLALRRWSDQEAILRTKARAQAHLLEFRLFLDDPRQLMHSQRDLLLDNLRLMRLLLPAFLILAIPMFLVMWQLDAFYGRAPLRVGEAALVSASSRPQFIHTPPGVIVETQAVYIQAERRTSWRIRPQRPVSGKLQVGAGERRIVTGAGISYLPEPLPGGNGIEIGYPRGTVLGLHWAVWFLVLSTVAGFLLRRPLRVTF
ncbi:MAG: hypothetical protein M3Z32_00175 [Acidobacteriota bacterium]|nr:hypothetical protein [Acidobacteriota bacterium]